MEELEFPDDLYFTKEHEWARKSEGDDALIAVGITDYAQDALGDIVYVDLPSEGTELQKDETFGVIESVKAVSDLYAPVSGQIVEVNDGLGDSPEVVNEDPYGEAWMVKIRVSDERELEELMNTENYRAFVEDQKEEA